MYELTYYVYPTAGAVTTKFPPAVRVAVYHVHSDQFGLAQLQVGWFTVRKPPIVLGATLESEFDK